MGLIIRALRGAGWFAVGREERWRARRMQLQTALTRTAPVGVLAAIGLMGFGTAWDIQWHATVGRDSLWLAPHLTVYSGTLLAVALGSVMLLWPRAGPRAFWSDPYALVWAGSWVMATAAVVDMIWHALIGDRTLWSPPHALGVSGAVIIVFGSVITWRQARRRRLFPSSVCTLAEIVLLAGCLVAAYYGLRAPVILVFRPDFPMPPFLMTTSPYVTAGLASLMVPAIVVWCRSTFNRWWVDLALLGAVLIWMAQEILHRLFTPWFAVLAGSALELSRAPDAWFGLLTLGFMLMPALAVNHTALRRPVLSGAAMAGLYVAAVAVWLITIGRVASISPAIIGGIIVLGGVSGWAGAVCAQWIRRMSDLDPA